MERRLAVILAADVVGYSRMIRADEEGTLEALKATLKDLIEPRIAEHKGRVVKLMGDGILAEFSSVTSAIRMAAEVQDEIARRNAPLPEDRRIVFRIGVNLGDVVIDGDDIQGDGVNVAARLEGLAEPGGVCISASVYEQVRDKLNLTFRDMGERQVKNIDRPIRTWQWVAGSEPTKTAAPDAPAPLELPDKPSIVVLPFNNMSGDADQEYFSDGISEDIITDLSKVSGLFVIARNSAFVYKGKPVNVPDVCRDLGVRFALEGSVRKAGNRVRITAQLIDGTRGGHVWAERYDRDLTDIFEVQDDVTQQIVEALKVTLSETEKSLLSDGGTRDVEAHDLYLKGRALMFGRNRDAEMFEQSMSCYRRAIELDPNYAGAYAGIAMAYVLDFQNHWSAASEASLERAEHYVDEAIAKDENDSFAHYVAAVMSMWKKDYDRWAYESERALALSPSFALALNSHGIVYIYTGEPTKAIPYIERAMRLDPAAQHGQFLHFLGMAHFVARDYEAAAKCFRDRIASNPTTDLSRAFLASALGHMNEPEEARRTWAELMQINPHYSYEDHIGRLPFKNPVDAESFIDGLRKAELANQ